MCGIGAVGLLLWAYFHLLRKDLIDFMPNHQDPKAGPYGKRAWYSMLLFPSVKSSGGINIEEEMTYQSMVPFFTLALARNANDLFRSLPTCIGNAQSQQHFNF